MSNARPILAICALAALALVGLSGGWFLGRTGVPPAPSRPGHAAASPAATADRVMAPARPTASSSSPSANAAPDVSSVRPAFLDVAAKRGVAFDYVRGETGEKWLPETMGGGVAWLDFDGDGRLDVFFVQGCQLPRDDSGRHAAVLYRNNGPDAWGEVPRWAAPSNARYGVGVAVADADNDGFDDVYVTNFGVDSYYVNQGDGTFRESAAAAGLASSLWGTSAAFGDLDRDGDLDLFVANYIQHDTSIVCVNPATGRRKYCGPDYFEGQHDLLYENLGDGTFADVSADAGVVRSDSKGLGVVIADLLGDDGVPEIFVANDLRTNFLFRNATRGGDSATSVPLRFDEIGFESGAGVNAEGVREANMGIAVGDYDEDGDLDLYVTHYYMEHDTLWQNQGRSFRDVTKVVGLSLPTLRQLSWGTNFIDFDNDGWLDVFVTSGHLNSDEASGVPYAMRPQLFYNAGSRGRPVRFVDVSNRAGAYFEDTFVGRSSAAADFDRDGDTDLVVGHHHRPAALLENRTAGAGNAFGLVLVGAASNRAAIGARITLHVGGPAGPARRLVRELVGGGSYLSADSREIVVGLGAADRVAEIEIRWPSDDVTRHRELRAGGYWIIREDSPSRRFRAWESAGADADR
jgi:hypothetical protein